MNTMCLNLKKCLVIWMCLAALSVAAADITVATHYFYWYLWPNEHFRPKDQLKLEGHYHHFVTPEKVSYLSEDWHAGELWMMKAAGIDVALPVYWGAPGAYGKPGISFSVAGLGPMVRAAERLGERSPKLGLFYDTSTLLNDVRGAIPAGAKADLTTDAGRQLFAKTIVDYFERIPRKLWARMDGRALVVLYSSAFAEKWDKGLTAWAKKMFENQFPGEGLFLVADSSWGEIGQDRTTEWGAALVGPKLHQGVAQIGAGYNDSPVPGRTTPFREREDGNYYRYSWQKAIVHQPELVLIETWNEMHEGTEICQSQELGLKYVELTAEWITRMRNGGPIGEPIHLRFPNPRSFKDLSWGEDSANTTRIYADYRTGQRVGLREIQEPDGKVRLLADRLVSPPRKKGWDRYVYFQVSDHWRFESPQESRMKVRLELAKPARVTIDYDSHDPQSIMAGSYKRVPPSGGDRPALTHEFQLNGAFFGNRQNGGSDLRLVLNGGAVEIRRLEILVEDGQ